MPNRGKNKYVSINFQRQFNVKIESKDDGKLELTLDTPIELDPIDVPELEDTRERFPEPKD